MRLYFLVGGGTRDKWQPSEIWIAVSSHSPEDQMHGVFMAPEQSRFESNPKVTGRTPQGTVLTQGFHPLALALKFPKGRARLCRLRKKRQLEEYARE